MPGFHFAFLTMRLFLDSADRTQWQTWLPTGLFYGVTTNPLLLERAGEPCTLPHLHSLAQEALSYGIEELQLQTWGTTVAEMVQRGVALATDPNDGFGLTFHPKIVIKVPMTPLGIQAAQQLQGEGIPITLTAVYAPQQVALALALGVAYVAPYLGRIQDLGQDGRESLITMQRMIDRQIPHSPTPHLRLLAASLRSVEDVIALAVQGIHTFTLAPAIVEELIEVEATTLAAADFERSAQALAP